MNLDLTEDYLMHKYAKLIIRFEDSLNVLKRIKELTGEPTTAILSNGNTDMLATVVQSNGLKDYLDKMVSVDDAARTVFRQKFAVEKEDVLLVTSLKWDAMAAKLFGLDKCQVDRLGLPYERNQADYTNCSLASGIELDGISRLNQIQVGK